MMSWVSTLGGLFHAGHDDSFPLRLCSQLALEESPVLTIPAVSSLNLLVL